MLGQGTHGLDVDHFQPGNLTSGDAGSEIEAVCLLPLGGTLLSPSAEFTKRTRDRAGAGRFPDKPFEAITQEARIVSILRKPETDPLSCAELHMGILGHSTLNTCKQVRVEPQLQYVAWRGFSLELCVHDLVGECTKPGGSRYTHEEVRIPAPHPTSERALKHNVRASTKRIPCGACRLFKGHAICFNPNDLLTFGLKLQKILGFMPITVSLQQDSFLPVLDRKNIFPVKIAKIKPGRMWTGRKSREIRGRQPNPLFILSHWTISEWSSLYQQVENSSQTLMHLCDANEYRSWHVSMCR